MGPPEFEISVFHFLLIHPARVVPFILETWVGVTPNLGFFQLVSSSLFVRSVQPPIVSRLFVSN
jgi:hypothetical protein